MKNIFNMAQSSKPRKNAFDLSHERKFSCNMGDLVPIFCEDVVPGDSFKMSTEIMMRLAPMIAPIMHRVNVYTHFFFVPWRLIWDDSKDFITGGEDGNQNPIFPYYKINSDPTENLGPGTLADYLGYNFTDDFSGDVDISALPFRAYAEIFNEYYRDQNLEDKIEVEKDSGQQTGGVLWDMKKRAWEKDYFTSCLPWTQRGGEVTTPMQGSAPVKLKDGWLPQDPDQPRLKGFESGNPPDDDTDLHQINGLIRKDPTGGPDDQLFYDPSDSLEADLSEATASTINELRTAFKLQEWLEKNARGGSRYIEQIFSHFGVKSSDSRLQRPEFLGGGKSPIVISEVLQTSETDPIGPDASPQGNMAGHGISVGNTHKFKRFFEEHGIIMGIMSVIPKTAYQQGMRRQFTKFDKFDHYFPEFAHLGEQAILDKEIYNDGTGEATFGYQSRYAEYKYIPTTVHGDMKGESLNHWHMGRVFDQKPVLNQSFVESDPTHNIFAVTDEESHKLYVQCYHNIKAVRPMPTFGNPLSL